MRLFILKIEGVGMRNVGLEIHIENLSALALEGVQARNYRKNPEAAQAQDLQLKKAA